MAVKIGINGFGRIGRLTLRSIRQYHRDELEVVVINDLAPTRTNAHLFKWDTNYGRYQGTVSAGDGAIVVDGKTIKALAERDPAKISWKDYGVDIVIESTGLFTDATKAAAHFQGGAKKVLISAPARNEDITIVLGVNEDKYDPKKHRVISNASCTTNGIAPIVKVLNDSFGIVRGLLTTVHAYTNDQAILDMPYKDKRRGRAAAINTVPSTTGAAKALGEVVPSLKGKLHGYALRVPVPTGSITDLTFIAARKTSVDEINKLIKAAAAGPMKGIIEYCDEPIVSSDVIGNPASSIFDSTNTICLADDMVKVTMWYDNEWGYSNRSADLIIRMAK